MILYFMVLLQILKYLISITKRIEMLLKLCFVIALLVLDLLIRIQIKKVHIVKPNFVSLGILKKKIDICILCAVICATVQLFSYSMSKILMPL